MTTLTIYFADGSVRWVEHFNDLPSANRWIADEQTRPYWDQAWTYQIVDIPQPPNPLLSGGTTG